MIDALLALLSPGSVSGGCRAWCARFSALLNGLFADALPLTDFGCTADALPHVVHSIYSTESVVDRLSVCHDSSRGKSRSMASNSGSMSSGSNHGSDPDILHNTSGWRGNDDRRWGNSIGGSNRSPLRSRPDRRKSRGRCNDATDANDSSGCTVESL